MERSNNSLQMIILIGIPASGKSTFYTQNFSNLPRVSKDLMRKKKTKTKDEQQKQLIIENLSKNKSVVIDNNNESKEIRKPLIEMAKKFNAKVIGYYFQSNVKECLERNKKRSGKARVPDFVIFIKKKALQKPSYDEGFDELYYVKIEPEYKFNVQRWRNE